MFERVMVAVDGREGGRDAVALGTVLRAATGELTLAHIRHGDARIWGPTVPAGATELKTVPDLLERERVRAAVDAHLRWHVSASAGRGLHELAERVGADLLVVGSSHRGVLGRVMLGDDTWATLDGAPCAVAVAPAGYASRRGRISRIGVAYNGSPESEHALMAARELAGAHGARLTAFEAVSISAFAVMGGEMAIGETIDGLVEAAHERLSELEGVEPASAYGVPGEELARFSDSVDLLVVGSRGYGPLGRLMHGSVARHLIHSARCPVLVLTRAARAHDDRAIAGGRLEAARAPQ